MLPSVRAPESGKFSEERPSKKGDEPIMFKVVSKSGLSRAGLIHLRHGPVHTPVYMPVGTKGAMKALLA